MVFRSAMCPNCDSIIKLDSESGSIFCANCGIRLNAEDAFVYYELKTGGEPDVGKIDGYKLLMSCAANCLEQKKFKLADDCLEKLLRISPDDYQIWKMRAMTWESRVIDEFKKSFYEYSRKNGFKENREYIDRYREYCDNAVRNSPANVSRALADEFNERIRSHFKIAHKAYKKEKHKSFIYALIVTISAVGLAALALNSCRF